MTVLKRVQRSAFRMPLWMVFVYALLIGGSLFMMLPFVWMILGSLKSSAEIVRIPPTFFPEAPTLDNYLTILNDPNVPLLRFYMNSVLVSFSIVGLTLFTSSIGGYLFAKFRFRGKNSIFLLVLSTMMVPFPVLMIPSYLLLVNFGLINTLGGLIIPAAVSAFGIFMVKQFAEGLPTELLEAARMDGASEWQIYFRIILPQLSPVLATLGIITFLHHWNDYMWPLIVVTSLENRTLPLMLTWYNSANYQSFDMTMTASVMVVIPILIVYAILQRWITEGFALSGMK